MLSSAALQGCSSRNFAVLMGEANAQRMLGEEGWKPSAAEAQEAGFVQEVVQHEEVITRAGSD